MIFTQGIFQVLLVDKIGSQGSNPKRRKYQRNVYSIKRISIVKKTKLDCTQTLAKTFAK